MNERFLDRSEAGRQLAAKLHSYANHPNAMLLALPRGGVPVAFEVASQLNLPMDILLVRKLGVPGQEELAMGAIAMDGTRVLNEDIVRGLGITEETIEIISEQERRELERRGYLYRQGLPQPAIQGRVVIVVDDGLATGATMQAAISMIRHQKPEKVIVAVPVASAEACNRFEEAVGKCVCVMVPEAFHSVGHWYQSFEQVTDAEVRDLFCRAKQLHQPNGAA